MRETRLYYKGAHQQTYERFDTVRLAADEALLKRFAFLLLSNSRLDYDLRLPGRSSFTVDGRSPYSCQMRITGQGSRFWKGKR
jgi:hypothetical protein